MTDNRPPVAKLCGVCHDRMIPVAEKCCAACCRPEPGIMSAKKNGKRPTFDFVPADLPD